jgi:hypothetical protein
MMLMLQMILLTLTLTLAKEVDDRVHWKEKFHYYHKIEEFDQYFEKIEKDPNSPLERVTISNRSFWATTLK